MLQRTTLKEDEWQPAYDESYAQIELGELQEEYGEFDDPNRTDVDNEEDWRNVLRRTRFGKQRGPNIEMRTEEQQTDKHWDVIRTKVMIEDVGATQR